MSPDESTTPPTSPEETCPVCGAPSLREHQCKVVCPNCGYTESCEDIFPARPPQRDKPGKTSNDPAIE